MALPSELEELFARVCEGGSADDVRSVGGPPPRNVDAVLAGTRAFVERNEHALRLTFEAASFDPVGRRFMNPSGLAWLVLIAVAPFAALDAWPDGEALSSLFAWADLSGRPYA